jgi:dienelactone hydrolase
MASLISGKANAFKAAVQTSPALIDPADAEKVVIPMMMLASMDEPAGDVEKYAVALTVPKHVETFNDQVHGFMSARGDLNDSKGKAEYERGYQLALEFFHKHLV